MGTFHSWFEAQAGRGDDIGALAAGWKAAAGQRPRASGVETITRWLVAHPLASELPADQIEAVCHRAAAEYRGGSQHVAAVPIPGQPDAQVRSLPTPQQVAADHGWVAEQLQQAGQGGEQLSQLLEAAFGPVLREIAGDIKAIRTWQGRMEPLAQLLTDLAAEPVADSFEAETAEAEAATRDAERASGQGLSGALLDGQAAADQQPGPPAVDLYGGHVVAEPDFERLGALGEPGAEEEAG